MKKIYLFASVILCLLIILSCSLSPNLSPDDGFVAESPSFIDEAIGAFSIAINDYIWFGGDDSMYSHFQGTSFGYEVYEENGIAYIITTTPLYIQDVAFYHLFELGSFNGVFTNEITSTHFNKDLDELLLRFKSLPLESGTLVLDDAHKPTYSPYTTEKQNNLDKIKSALFRSVEDSTKVSALYIRDYYDVSIDTIIVYIYDGKTYYAYADTSGERTFKPTMADDEDAIYYVERIIECSFLIISPADKSNFITALADYHGEWIITEDLGYRGIHRYPPEGIMFETGETISFNMDLFYYDGLEMPYPRYMMELTNAAWLESEERIVVPVELGFTDVYQYFARILVMGRIGNIYYPNVICDLHILNDDELIIGRQQRFFLAERPVAN